MKITKMIIEIFIEQKNMNFFLNLSYDFRSRLRGCSRRYDRHD